MVIPLHLVVKYLRLLRGTVGDQTLLDDAQDVITDITQLILDLGLVILILECWEVAR